jgi:spore germination protein GerM
VRAKLVLLTLLAGLAACARTSGPVEVPVDELPVGVLRSPSAPTTAFDVTVYLVGEDRLVQSPRSVRGTSDVDAAVRGLLHGPTRSERGAGIFTAIPPDTELLDIRVAGTIAEIDLSREFEAPTSRQHVVLRLAQVVWTLTALSDVSAVRFLVDGEQADVFTAAGTVVERPVTAEDYPAMASSQTG